MSLSKGAVKKIVLSLIGGIPLGGIPTTRILCAQPVAAQMNLGALAGLAVAVAAPALAGKLGGLSAISENPLGSLTTDIENTLDSLSKENFSGLDTTLTNVSTDTDPSVVDAYSNLKKAFGGSDGTSGALSVMQKFKNHTNRISGQVMSTDSELNTNSSEQTPGGR